MLDTAQNSLDIILRDIFLFNLLMLSIVFVGILVNIIFFIRLGIRCLQLQWSTKEYIKGIVILYLKTVPPNG